MKIGLIFLLLVISGCVVLHESTIPSYQASFGAGAEHKYEIELHYRHEVQGGNMHMLFLDLKKHVTERTYWLYTDSLEGELLPGQFQLCFFKETKGNKCNRENLKGKVVLSDSSVVLMVQEPLYNEKDKPYQWNQSEFNGKWLFKRR